MGRRRGRGELNSWARTFQLFNTPTLLRSANGCVEVVQLLQEPSFFHVVCASFRVFVMIGNATSSSRRRGSRRRGSGGGITTSTSVSMNTSVATSNSARLTHFTRRCRLDFHWFDLWSANVAAAIAWSTLFPVARKWTVAESCTAIG